MKKVVSLEHHVEQVNKHRKRLSFLEQKAIDLKEKVCEITRKRCEKLFDRDVVVEFSTYDKSIKVLTKFGDRRFNETVFSITSSKYLSTDLATHFYSEEQYSYKLDQFNLISLVVKDYQLFIAGKRSRLFSPIFDVLSKIKEMDTEHKFLSGEIKEEKASIAYIHASKLIYVGSDFSGLGTDVRYYSVGGETNSISLTNFKINRLTDKSIICYSNGKERRFDRDQVTKQIANHIYSGTITEEGLKKLIIRQYAQAV